MDRYRTCTGPCSSTPSCSSRQATSRATAPFSSANGLPRSRACRPCACSSRCLDVSLARATGRSCRQAFKAILLTGSAPTR